MTSISTDHYGFLSGFVALALIFRIFRCKDVAAFFLVCAALGSMLRISSTLAVFVPVAGPWFFIAGLILWPGNVLPRTALAQALGGVICGLAGSGLLSVLERAAVSASETVFPLLQFPFVVSAFVLILILAPWFARPDLPKGRSGAAGLCLGAAAMSVAEASRTGTVICFGPAEVLCLAGGAPWGISIEGVYMVAILTVLFLALFDACGEGPSVF